jgi:hypothetical protein
LTKSLTALLQPYIRGATIQAYQVQLPAGRFRLEIEIADITGAKTTEAYRSEQDVMSCCWSWVMVYTMFETANVPSYVRLQSSG